MDHKITNSLLMQNICIKYIAFRKVDKYLLCNYENILSKEDTFNFTKSVIGNFT